MPALNFKARFADLVASGAKPQTIRALRKRPFRKGDTLYLYTGMRTKNCRRLRAPTQCIRAVPFSLHIAKGRAFFCVDGRYLYSDEANLLAVRDGFGGICEMVEFFEATHGLPFHGQLVEWKP